MASVDEEPRGLLRKHVRNEDTLCGNYLLPVNLIHNLVGQSPPKFPWLESVRFEVQDCLEACQHGCYKVVYSLDWWFPKSDSSQAEDVDLQQYAEVNAFMLSNCQEKTVKLCAVCQKDVGPVLDIARISLGLSYQLSQTAEMYARWFLLNSLYKVRVPLRPQSTLEYTAVWKDGRGTQYVFEPRANTLSRETHVANQNSYTQKQTRRKALPPNEYHALFWIFAFLLELLDKEYANAPDIPHRHRKDRKQWVNAHVMKVQPDQNGRPHPLRDTLSGFCHRVVDVRGFVDVMREHLRQQIAAANDNDVLGFTGFKSSHIELEALVVRLANITAALLPKTNFFQIHPTPDA